MIQDLSGSWCIKGTNESTLDMDSSAPSDVNDPDRCCIPDSDPDHPKRMHPNNTQKTLEHLICITRSLSCA